MKSAFIYIVFCFSALHFTLAQDDYKFRKFTQDHGLPNDIITGIVQDDFGFIWMATQDGLCRYDGYNFKTFHHDPSDTTTIAHDRLFCMIRSKSGMIWIGTEGGGANAFDPNTEKFVAYTHKKNDPNSICSNEIYSIREDHKGNIWFGSSNNGVSKLNLKTGKFTHYRHDPDNVDNTMGSGAVWNVFEDSKHQMWFSTWGIGLTRFDPKTGTMKHYGSKGDPATTVSSPITGTIVEDESQRLWITNWGSGLDIYDLKTETFEHLKHDPLNSHSLAGNELWPIVKGVDGNIWMGTYNHGLIKYDHETKKFANFTTENGLMSHNDIWSLFIDKSGILWVGTDGGGITKVISNQKKFGHVFHKSRDSTTIGHNSVRAIYRDRNDVLWIGDWKGHINKYNKTRRNFKRHFLGQTFKVGSFVEDPEGTFWVGSYRHGIFSYDREQYEVDKIFTFDPEDEKSISHNHIQCQLIDSRNRHWIGTRNGLNIFDKSTGTFKRYFREDKNGIADNTVYAVFEDSKGRIWVGTKDGLSLYREETGDFKNIKRDASKFKTLPHNTINCISEDTSGNLWIGTKKGLCKFMPETDSYVNYTTEEGLPGDIIVAILPDNEGMIWISSKGGLSKYVPNENKFVNYDIRDGTQGNSFAVGAFFKDRFGKLYFGGNNGYNTFYPHEIKDNPFIPPLAITSLKINNKHIDKNSNTLHTMKEITLTYKEKDIEFQFAALNYDLPEKNRYKYMLEGNDKKWIDNEHNIIARYTNLSPGDYTFRVIGSNNDRRWNDVGTSIKIKILPPFWETTLFYVFQSIFFLTLLGFSVYYNRSNKHTPVAKVLAFLSLFMVFEYIFVIIEPTVDELSQGAPFFKVLLNLVLALTIIPVEKLIEKRFTK